ncbi:MAG: flavodoxin family protein [Oscillospiraceae bacterium]|nr:flavodoxin family protein [Oscillospiraceae bacterium]
MKILIINGSPKGKRSNSLRLAEAFVKGMGTKVSTDVQTVELSSMNINGCKGCFGCWKATPGKCVIKDDMPLIIEKLIEADVIVYSFPLYYFSVPGILKNMIDRQLPMVLPFMAERTDGVGSGSHPGRYDMSGKRFVLISTCGFYFAQGNYDAVCSMFDHICGKDNYEKIFCGQGELFSIEALNDHTARYLGIVERAGAEFAGGSIGKATKDELSQLLFPKEQFEAMADASWGVSREGKNTDKADKSLVFTKQMAALYNKNSFDGKERVLEIRYTDLDKKYQIILKKDGSEFITEDFLEPTTVIETPFTVWTDIAEGKENGAVALGKHLYTVNGDFSLMVNWDRYFGVEKPVEKSVSDKKPPVMSAMLIPWCVFWTIMPFVGAQWAIIPLAAAALTPVFMIKHELTIYDRLSAGAVAILSALTLITGDTDMPRNIGYIIFGSMWFISCFTKEPLCAAYVKYSYGGESALSNPLFMKTNYILAAAWGGLYLITAALSWMLCGHAVVFSALSSILPAAMGAFTAFFINWYPKHLAAGAH